jgi:hypothetical protein
MLSINLLILCYRNEDDVFCFSFFNKAKTNVIKIIFYYEIN